jgi:hypothetical protein
MITTRVGFLMGALAWFFVCLTVIGVAIVGLSSCGAERKPDLANHHASVVHAAPAKKAFDAVCDYLKSSPAIGQNYKAAVFEQDRKVTIYVVSNYIPEVNGPFAVRYTCDILNHDNRTEIDFLIQDGVDGRGMKGMPQDLSSVNDEFKVVARGIATALMGTISE